MNDWVRKWQSTIGFTGRDVDGDFGEQTFKRSAAGWKAPTQVSAPVTTPDTAYGPWPRQSDVAAFYGPAGGPDCTAGRVALPFAFPLAWDADQRVTSFACHRKVAAALTSIFAEAAKHYGEAEYRRLRLDQFGGCYNYRPIRGGTSLSMHSWGIAVDLDPINNQLHWNRTKAAFAKPAYEPFWKIVEAHGATSLGRRRDWDWMHLQFASL